MRGVGHDCFASQVNGRVVRLRIRESIPLSGMFTRLLLAACNVARMLVAQHGQLVHLGTGAFPLTSHNARS